MTKACFALFAAFLFASSDAHAANEGSTEAMPGASSEVSDELRAPSSVVIAVEPPRPDLETPAMAARERAMDGATTSAKRDGLTSAFGPSLFEKVSGQYRAQDQLLFQE